MPTFKVAILALVLIGPSFAWSMNQTPGTSNGIALFESARPLNRFAYYEVAAIFEAGTAEASCHSSAE